MSAAVVLETVAWLACVVALGVVLAPLLVWAFDEDVTRHPTWRRRVEAAVLRSFGVRADEESTWTKYCVDVLSFNGLGMVLVFAVLRLQHLLPLNPQQLGPVPMEVAINTAVSFGTNTNWQAYSGEASMSYFSQMAALGVQNFTSAATGIAAAVALARGLRRQSSTTIGSFWVDLVRSCLWVLLPLSLVFALVLVACGVPMSFEGPLEISRLDAASTQNAALSATQHIPRGPVASQVAIKQLGTNGGGFYGVNSAHPFENPNILSNLLQSLALLALPGGIAIAFGRWAGRPRHGWMLFATMLALFVPLLVVCVAHEVTPPSALDGRAIDAVTTDALAGGHMEGKEIRFGAVQSAIWAAATTAASNGSVNSMHDSYSPIGGLVPMFLMQLGEVVFGGVGSGAYGLVVFALVGVFVAGLMVGRSPEYLGKAIEPKEMKLVSLAVLAPVAATLLGAAIASLPPWGGQSVANPGPHGFSEILYAYSSAANNNGSAFGGFAAARPIHAYVTAVAMLVGRYGVMVAVFALAGSLANKKAVPVTSGTLPTETPLFVVVLVGSILLVGALSFLPALALGPIADAVVPVAP